MGQRLLSGPEFQPHPAGLQHLAQLGGIGRLQGRITHDDPDPLFDYFARHNRYSDWEAHLQVRESRTKVDEARTTRGRRYARVPFKPVAFFLYSYVARQGFRDGHAGFHYAVAHAFYYWQIGIKRRDLLLDQLTSTLS